MSSTRKVEDNLLAAGVRRAYPLRVEVSARDTYRFSPGATGYSEAPQVAVADTYQLANTINIAHMAQHGLHAEAQLQV